MKIRDKILLYFSGTITLLLGVALLSIYLLFAAYREEDFQQRQNTKIKQTLIFLNQYKAFGKELAGVMDQLTINDFYDEKMLVFDSQKKMIFSSVDNLTISNYDLILNQLSPENNWIETKFDNYDIVAVYVKAGAKDYYAISKAFDDAGYSKINFLGNVLIGIFLFISVIVVLISVFLANRIAQPIVILSERLNNFDLNIVGASTLSIDKSSFELQQLTGRFNALLHKTNEAFLFQKHAVNHISHELKTPITILVSELEILKNIKDIQELQPVLNNQIQAAKSLGDIINILLEIAKYDAGQKIRMQSLRMDELMFDTIAELHTLYPDHNFDVNYKMQPIDEQLLQVFGNEMLMKQVFQNLLINAVRYGNSGKTKVIFDTVHKTRELSICIINPGETIAKVEEKYVFNYFFRGENSKGQSGFGLGLVLTKKIILLHSGTIQYFNNNNNLNTFEIRLPLS